MIPAWEFDQRDLPGVEAMDTTNREFVALVNELSDCERPRFIELLPEPVAHTRAHFATEEEMMERFAAGVHRGRTRFAQAYVIDQLTHWFDLHAATMDSALAAHLKGSVKVSRGPQSAGSI